MLLQHEISCDAPLADMFAMSGSGFRQASAEATAMLSAEVTITANREGFSVHVDPVQPTEGMPGMPVTGGRLESLVTGLGSPGTDKEQAAGVAWLEVQR